MELANASKNASDQIYHTLDVARLLDVDVNTVTGWIDSGRLDAYTPYGGFQEIRLENLLEFLRLNNMPVPLELRRKTHKSILVIDDDESVLNSIKSALRKMPAQYDIFTSSNGYQAGILIHKHKPQLLILDLMLNGINSTAISNAVRRSDIPIKILGISGFDSEENKKQMLESGANDFLGKPFNIAELLQKIKLLLDE